MARSIATWPGIALLCAGAGCTYMAAIRPLAPEKEAEINGTVEGRVAELTIKGEPRTLLGKDLRLDGNSVRLRASDPAWPEGVAWLPETEKPLASVRQIAVRDHGRGALYGLVIGASTGLVAGAIGTGVYMSNCTDECNAVLVIPFVAAYSLLSGLLGAALGGAIGVPRVIELKDAPSR